MDALYDRHALQVGLDIDGSSGEWVTYQCWMQRFAGNARACNWRKMLAKSCRRFGDSLAPQYYLFDQLDCTSTPPAAPASTPGTPGYSPSNSTSNGPSSCCRYDCSHRLCQRHCTIINDWASPGENRFRACVLRAAAAIRSIARAVKRDWTRDTRSQSTLVAEKVYSAYLTNCLRRPVVKCASCAAHTRPGAPEILHRSAWTWLALTTIWARVAGAALAARQVDGTYGGVRVVERAEKASIRLHIPSHNVSRQYHICRDKETGQIISPMRLRSSCCICLRHSRDTLPTH